MRIYYNLDAYGEAYENAYKTPEGLIKLTPDTPVTVPSARHLVSIIIRANKFRIYQRSAE